MHDSAIVTATSFYVNMGMPIIPLCSWDHEGMSRLHVERCKCAGKMPLIKGWQNWQETSMKQVNEWLQQFASMNIGLPLGDRSGYVGIDVDGDSGEDLLQQMSGGDVPETWEYSTGAGRRLLYQIPVGMKTKKYKQTGDGVHQECAILCTGQQTVLPPSIHYTGRRYTWKEGFSPAEIDCAEAPAWLIKLVRQEEVTLDLTKVAVAQTKPRVNIQFESNILERFIQDDSSVFSSDIDSDKPVQTKKKGKGKTGHQIVIDDEFIDRVVQEGGRDDHMTKLVGHWCALHRNLGKDSILMLALAHNQAKMVPPLDKASVEQKVNYFWEAEQSKASQFKSTDREKVQFESPKIAQVVLNTQEEQGFILRVDEEQIWRTHQEKGPWERLDTKGLKWTTLIHNILIDANYGGQGAWATEKNIDQVTTSLRVLLYEKGMIWQAGGVSTQSMEDSRYVPLRNGNLLDWATETEIPWNPEFLYNYTLPWNYDVNASCPNWERRLKEWLPDEQTRMVVQEFVGYSLIPYMGFGKALWFIGGGANGKSIFTTIIGKLFGRDISAAVNMQTLFSRFGSQYLEGRLINLVEEAAIRHMDGPKADTFKNLVTGGEVMADVKNKAMVRYNNIAKFIFSSNEQIKSSDKSVGLTRRLLIVNFDQDFSQSKTTTFEIMEELLPELDGIAVWAVQGLRRLMHQNGFTESLAIKKQVELFASDNDIMHDFMTHCIKPVPVALCEQSNGSTIVPGVPTRLIYNLFASWCLYRESQVKKYKSKVDEYFEEKTNYTKVRKSQKHILQDSSVSKTMCFEGCMIAVDDWEFLEFLETVSLEHGVEDKAFPELVIREMRRIG